MYVAKSEPEQGTDNKPLNQVDLDRIRRKRASYNALWVGRIVLLAVGTQYCGIVLLWFRRAIRAYQVRVWAIDTRNLQMVSGGLTAVIISLVISFLNIEWTIKDQPYDYGVILSDRLEEGIAAITRDITIPSEAAGTGRAVDIITAVGNASCESAGHLRNTSICTNAVLLRTRPVLALLSYALPVEILNRIRSHVPHFILLNKTKHFYIRFRALSLKVSNAGLCIFL